MALADIILRIVNHAPLTTKGAELTWQELDDNIVELFEAINTINNASSLAPYSPSTEYSNVAPDYVSYGGNVWVFVNAVPQTGITPGTDGATWQLSSVGALAHAPVTIATPANGLAISINQELSLAIKTFTSAITAFAGGGQASATALATLVSGHSFFRIDTVSSNLDSVKPDATVTVGMQMTILNRGANPMNVYPFSGNRFLSVDSGLMAIDAPFEVANGNGLSWTCFENGIMTIN